MTDDVDFVSGRTRLFGIVGDPIEQVRSPELFTAEFRRRGHHALMVPMRIPPEHFDEVLPALMRLANLDGLAVTLPFKARALAIADTVGANARVVGAVNALRREADGRWHADIFDGLGCVEAFRRRGLSFAGKRVLLIGTGGAGSAIAAAVAHQGPGLLRLHDVDTMRAAQLAQRLTAAHQGLAVTCAEPAPANADLDGFDILMNATPVGMLSDARMPVALTQLPASLIVFDAIVKPHTTPLLALAESCGCVTVRGGEMLAGQIALMTDFFGMAKPTPA
jgi:shikimate dehydrogenase